jgi:alkylation response protein AidB-like acyl-CoA dehydrogenase
MTVDVAAILQEATRLDDSDVRLIPDGCDYLLVGTANRTSDPGSAWFAVQVKPPGGGKVLALVPADARGVTVDRDTVTFERTPVPAGRLVATPG